MKLLDRFKWANKANERPDFSGKIVVVYSAREQLGGIFQDARLVKIGFSNFVVGRRIELEPSLYERWSSVTFWIAIHDIAQMMIFDDIEAAKRAFQSDETEVKAGPISPDSGGSSDETSRLHALRQ